MILVYILFIIICYKIIGSLFIKKDNTFDYYFGVPGSGKSTYAAWLSKKTLKKKKNNNVYSNVSIKDCYKIDVKEDIGKNFIGNGLLIVDEAGIDYNNREVLDRYIKRSERSMSKEAISFYKEHRHFNMNIAIFSQDFEDADITLRRLATRYYLVKKSFFPLFVSRRLILKKISINKDTHQIEHQYHFAFLGIKLIFSPSLWKMFNSYETYDLPFKEFEKY